MGLIDLQDDEEMFKEIAACCKPKDGSEFIERYDLDWAILVDKWKDSKADLYQATQMEQVYRKKLIEACKGQNTEGYGVKAQKIMRRGSIQYSSIPELQDVDLDQYRDMPTESWRITLDE